MITKDKIRNYIDKIPPAPETLKETISLLQEGELIKASKVAKSDLALSSYLHDLVNRPAYGFSSEVSDVSQIFGILGVNGSQQAVYNYMITLLSPDKWVLFKLNSQIFYELQAKLSKRWEQILKHLNINDRDIYSAITLLPASIIVTEALFCEKLEDVNLLRTNASLDYNTILERLCGMNLFDICQEIAIKWDMPDKIIQIIQASSGLKPSDDKNINELGKWMHLLLFYQLSRPLFINANLNDFLDFHIDYVEDIYEDFSKVLEIS
jgi:HD-like signal output (HDOD) protein